jgi:hypothetical protein
MSHQTLVAAVGVMPFRVLDLFDLPHSTQTTGRWLDDRSLVNLRLLSAQFDLGSEKLGFLSV